MKTRKKSWPTFLLAVAVVAGATIGAGVAHAQQCPNPPCYGEGGEMTCEEYENYSCPIAYSVETNPLGVACCMDKGPCACTPGCTYDWTTCVAQGGPPSPSPLPPPHGPEPFLTPDQKRRAAQVGLLAGTLCYAVPKYLAIPGVCVPPTPLCEVAVVVETVSCVVALLAGALAIDPPDPNFRVIATPTIATIPRVTARGNITQAEADVFNAFLVNQAAILGIGQAVITSGNRAQGAHVANNRVVP